MAAEALPAPTTTILPRGGSGRFRGTTLAGSAAATAASNMAVSKLRVSATMTMDPSAVGQSKRRQGRQRSSKPLARDPVQFAVELVAKDKHVDPVQQAGFVAADADA